jgi:hypothetical protein
LLLAAREEISRGLAAGDSCRVIAQRLGRAPSTVSREVPAMAAAAATGPRPLTLQPTGGRGGPRRPSWCSSPGVAGGGGDKLALRWSPRQIAGWLPLAFPEDPVMRVSHETI